MQRWIGILVVACLGVSTMLAAGCGREETQEDNGVVSQPETMQMDQDMGSGVDAMEGMDHAMEGMDHGMMAKTTDNGAAVFQQHCAICHPGGSNIITPAKTLDRQTLANNNITSVKDIVATLRKPGPGMTTFSPEMLSDKEAEQVAEHILSTY